MRPCNRCGRCCLNLQLGSATEQDILIWKKKKPEVLDYVCDCCSDLWISPVTGEEMNRCPWLRKLPKKEQYKCRIYELRPEVCRDYPVNIEQMINNGCEMLEEKDLDKPHGQLFLELQELKKATKTI